MRCVFVCAVRTAPASCTTNPPTEPRSVSLNALAFSERVWRSRSRVKGPTLNYPAGISRGRATPPATASSPPHPVSVELPDLLPRLARRAKSNSGIAHHGALVSGRRRQVFEPFLSSGHVFGFRPRRWLIRLRLRRVIVDRMLLEKPKQFVVPVSKEFGQFRRRQHRHNPLV